MRTVIRALLRVLHRQERPLPDPVLHPLDLVGPHFCVHEHVHDFHPESDYLHVQLGFEVCGDGLCVGVGGGEGGVGCEVVWVQGDTEKFTVFLILGGRGAAQ